MKSLEELIKKSKFNNSAEANVNINEMKYKNRIFYEDSSENNLEEILMKLQEHLTKNHRENFVRLSEENDSKEVIEEEIIVFCIENNISIKNQSFDETVKQLKESILDYDILTPLIFFT